MINRLEKGDEIEIVAPASYIEDEAKFKLGIEILERWGLRVNKNINIIKFIVETISLILRKINAKLSS